MATTRSVVLRTDMNLQEIHKEIAKLGDINTVPDSEASLDGHGNEVLYLRVPSAADKLKRLFMPKEMQEVNRNRLMSLIEIACKNAGIADNAEALTDVRHALRTGNGKFQDKLATLATIGALNTYGRGANELF